MSVTNIKPVVVLTIAGSDCSGGAGIQADLKTFTALQCYGTSILTALTAQNTVGVDAVHAPPPEFVKQQLLCVLTDMDVHGIKTGMLYDEANTRAVTSTLKSFFESSEKPMPPLVVDPVSVSTSGHTLLTPEAVKIASQELFPLASLITPNKMEAQMLLGLYGHRHAIATLEDALNAAIILSKCTQSAILLKGGHLAVNKADIMKIEMDDPDVAVEWSRSTSSTHILRGTNDLAESFVVDVLVVSKSGTDALRAPADRIHKYARDRVYAQCSFGVLPCKWKHP
ncbi:Phosphomethylpyrimidine kinase type-1 [Rickenella mellea]|uniref:Phosphomethylpyrimidine kinase type-1 n=1 Tax=Rickenella mellea TaxID=50990 RepID=A0A4Y7PSY0_9AGAM|nr:Phosphomethylpyrimidine kinase type-1 [Rickenella mellea]